MSFEQQAAFALASQVAHSFFEAQDARSIDAAARRMEVRRIISVINDGIENPTARAADHLLTGDNRGRRRRRRGLLAGAKHGGSRDEGEDSDFHVCGC